MRLRVPLAEVLHVTAAAGARPVRVGIRQRSGAEDLAPALAAAKTIGGVDGVTRFVAQDAHRAFGAAAFDVAHHAALEPLEARMREIERHGDAGHAVGRKPFFRQPHVRTKTDLALVELAIQAAHAFGHGRTFDLEFQIAEAQAQQLFIGHARPRAHSPPDAGSTRGRHGRHFKRVDSVAESCSEGHERVSEKPVRTVDDHFLLHQAVTPDSRNRAHTVIGAGDLAVGRGDHVRVATQVRRLAGPPRGRSRCREMPRAQPPAPAGSRRRP